MDKKAFEFEIKQITDAGEFEGIASVYGVEDLGGDVIEPGAFTKTIQENPVVPILWQHEADQVIGEGSLSEQGSLVIVKGKFDMEDPVAVKACAKLRKKLIKGLSIGFNAIKVTWQEIEDKYVRHINELRLWEVSVVTFPMLPEAQVTAVKAADQELPAVSFARAERKAGRTISSATRARLEAAMQEIQALLADESTSDATTEAGEKGVEAAEENTEPVIDHSEFSSAVETAIKEIRSWNNLNRN